MEAMEPTRLWVRDAARLARSQYPLKLLALRSTSRFRGSNLKVATPLLTYTSNMPCLELCRLVDFVPALALLPAHRQQPHIHLQAARTASQMLLAGQLPREQGAMSGDLAGGGTDELVSCGEELSRGSAALLSAIGHTVARK